MFFRTSSATKTSGSRPTSHAFWLIFASIRKNCAQCRRRSYGERPGILVRHSNKQCSLRCGTIPKFMKERPMALKEIELRPGWFIYRCESCGFEHPQMG